MTTSATPQPTAVATGPDQVRARVVFLIRVPVDRAEDFLAAYEQIRYQVAEGVPGHVVDQLCQSPADPEQWLITSEWATLAAFEAWERSPDHRELVKPMRECMTEARSTRFLVRRESRRCAPAEQPTSDTARESP